MEWNQYWPADSCRASVVGLLATASDWWRLWIDIRAFGSHTGHFLVMRNEMCEDEENCFFFLSSKNTLEGICWAELLSAAFHHLSPGIRRTLNELPLGQVHRQLFLAFWGSLHLGTCISVAITMCMLLSHNCISTQSIHGDLPLLLCSDEGQSSL